MEKQVRILFVCHGNICRSPMAEFVLENQARALGLGGAITVESAATSAEEIGNPVHAVEYMDTTSRDSEDVYGWTVKEVSE